MEALKLEANTQEAATRMLE